LAAATFLASALATLPLAAITFMRSGLPRSPPRRLPRALAAAKAAVVRAEIHRSFVLRDCCKDMHR
jgi:hypothetical protein